MVNPKDKAVSSTNVKERLIFSLSMKPNSVLGGDPIHSNPFMAKMSKKLKSTFNEVQDFIGGIVIKDWREYICQNRP